MESTLKLETLYILYHISYIFYISQVSNDKKKLPFACHKELQQFELRVCLAPLGLPFPVLEDRLFWDLARHRPSVLQIKRKQ